MTESVTLHNHIAFFFLAVLTPRREKSDNDNDAQDCNNLHEEVGDFRGHQKLLPPLTRAAKAAEFT
jgi:hypothetical protein